MAVCSNAAAAQWHHTVNTEMQRTANKQADHKMRLWSIAADNKNALHQRTHCVFNTMSWGCPKGSDVS